MASRLRRSRRRVPNIASYKSLSGNDLLAALAADVSTLRDKFKGVEGGRADRSAPVLSNWRLAEHLVALGAVDQQGRPRRLGVADGLLLADPDPVPPLISAAAETLRAKLNAVHADWEAAWQKGEQRLAHDPTWGKLSPEQKHTIRQECGLTDGDQADRWTRRKLSPRRSRNVACRNGRTCPRPCRRGPRMRSLSAAALLEPKARAVSLPGAMLKSEEELDEWLSKVRERDLERALAEGPVIPKV